MIYLLFYNNEINIILLILKDNNNFNLSLIIPVYVYIYIYRNYKSKEQGYQIYLYDERIYAFVKI